MTVSQRVKWVNNFGWVSVTWDSRDLLNHDKIQNLAKKIKE